MLLFGKVPQDQQLSLSIVTFGSVAWIVALLGAIFPKVGAFLLTLVTLPDWVQDAWIRWAMLGAVALIPLVVGFVSLRLVDPEDQPSGFGARAAWVLKGYLYALGLALTLVMMIVLAPIMKVQDIARRWSSTHVPVLVEPEDYLSVVGDVQRALERGGITTERHRATWMLRLPTKVLAFLAGGMIENLSADELTTLKARSAEVLLHPSDLVIRGRELDVARAHAILTEHLTFTRAYLTWTKEANEVEDRLRETWESLKARPDAGARTMAAHRLRTLERELGAARLSYEEWEVLFREKLQVERTLLRLSAGMEDRPSVAPRNASQNSPSHGANSRLALIPVLAGLATFIALTWRDLAARRYRLPALSR